MVERQQVEERFVKDEQKERELVYIGTRMKYSNLSNKCTEKQLRFCHIKV